MDKKIIESTLEKLHKAVRPIFGDLELKKYSKSNFVGYNYKHAPRGKSHHWLSFGLIHEGEPEFWLNIGALKSKDDFIPIKEKLIEIQKNLKGAEINEKKGQFLLRVSTPIISWDEEVLAKALEDHVAHFNAIFSQLNKLGLLEVNSFKTVAPKKEIKPKTKKTKEVNENHESILQQLFDGVKPIFGKLELNKYSKSHFIGYNYKHAPRGKSHHWLSFGLIHDENPEFWLNVGALKSKNDFIPIKDKLIEIQKNLKGAEINEKSEQYLLRISTPIKSWDEKDISKALEDQKAHFNTIFSQLNNLGLLGLDSFKTVTTKKEEAKTIAPTKVIQTAPVEIKKEQVNCEKCKKILSVDDKFCSQCGTPVSNEKQKEIPQKLNKKIAVVQKATLSDLLSDTKATVKTKSSQEKNIKMPDVLIPFRSNKGDKLWGYVDAKMNWIIRPKYYDTTPFFDSGYALVKIKKEGQLKQGLIDRKGNIVLKDFDFDTRVLVNVTKDRRKDFDHINKLYNHNVKITPDYEGIIDVMLGWGEQQESAFLDLKTGKFLPKKYYSIDNIAYNFYRVHYTRGRNLALLYKTKELIADVEKIQHLGKNYFKIWKTESSIPEYYKFELINNTPVFAKHNFALPLRKFKDHPNCGLDEEVTQVFEDYVETRYDTYWMEDEYGNGRWAELFDPYDPIVDEEYYAYYKNGKRVSKVKRSGQAFCISKTGGWVVKYDGYSRNLTDWGFFQYKDDDIYSLNENKKIYHNGMAKDDCKSYDYGTSCLVDGNNNSKLLFLDQITGKYKFIELYTEIDNIDEDFGFFCLGKSVNYFYQGLVDQNGNLVFEDFFKKGYISGIKPLKINDWYLVNHNGKEYLLDSNGFCFGEGEHIKDIYNDNQKNFTQKDIDELIKSAQNKNIITKQIVQKVKKINELSYLQLNYLNHKNLDNKEEERRSALAILRYHKVPIQKITFKLTCKKGYKGKILEREEFERGHRVEVSALFMGEKKLLTNAKAKQFIELHWLDSYYFYDTKDSVLDKWSGYEKLRKLSNVLELFDSQLLIYYSKPQIISVKFI